MKTRNGFVSNSSSSSFVVMGVPLSENIENRLNLVVPKKKDEEDYDWYERVQKKTKLRILYVERGDESYVIGKVLADVSSDRDFLERQNYSFEDLEIMVNEVISKLGGGDIDVKLMLGTRPS